MEANRPSVSVQKNGLLVDMEIVYETAGWTPEETEKGTEDPNLRRMRQWMIQDQKGFMKEMISMQKKHLDLEIAATEARGKEKAAKVESSTEEEPEDVERLCAELLDHCNKLARGEGDQ